MKNGSSILVPLDGSPLAEVALVEALKLARDTQSKIILFQAIEPADKLLKVGNERFYPDELDVRRHAEALQYLHSVAMRADFQGIEVQTHVVLGEPAESILNYAQHHDVVKIVIATHGRSGFKKWILGSVADKVLRGADRTVVLVRSH
jgi:nucleotide-binding universal stress UspA family protein